MIPMLSPHGLIQEQLFPNEWLVLVACMMLNCTKRKQVEVVLPRFIERWPTPAALLHASQQEIAEVIRPLGFSSKRSASIMKMTTRYLTSPWEHASELPGIGQYAARSWEIFCKGTLGSDPPKDHALVKYWVWRVQQSNLVVIEKALDNVAVDEEYQVGHCRCKE